jgi:hypothetical protein
MTKRLVMFLGVAALAQCLVSSACSSSGGQTGTGGSVGGGTGGAKGGGGSTGSGTCDKGGTVAAVGTACANVKNKAACDMDGIPGTADDTACWNTCGPNKSGTKNCTCTGGAWSCPTCDYDVADPTKYACYKTAGSAACPPDATDTSGMMLPASGGDCTLAPCTPCGSASATSYRDSSGSPKAGWCICVPKTDGTGGSVYSCASVLEWAPQCQ